MDIGQTPAYTGETPTRESSTSTVYTFAGWTPEVVPAADAADYTAAFNEAARTYAITWSWKDANGNDASTTDDVAFGTTPSAPSIPASYVANDVIYTFSAWSPTVEAVSGTATYTAQYTQSAAKATVITITDAGATTNVIGTYASFVEAVEAVPNGGTIVLLADDNVGADRIQVSTKSYTVDLNGQTLSSTEDDNIIFRVSNGQTITINGTTEGSTLVGTVMIAGSNTAVQEGHIVVNGGTVYGAAIAVSPHNTNKPIAVEINGGTFTAPESGSGVFHSQSGTLAISGGTITGGTAVFASRGTVNVTGGELVATGAAVADYTPPASYYSVSGDALVLVNRSAPVANITGGKFTSANAKAVASYASGSSEAVSGFLGAATAAGTAIFSDNESDGLANGYVFVDSETAGYYKVVGTATIIWVVDGQTPVTNKVAVGTLTASIQPEDPTKASVGQTAYSFTGWSPEVAETVTADATYVAQFIEGYDWTVDPFIITTEAELRAFAAAVNGGYGFTNQTVMLGNDITLTSAFTPIGQYEGSAFSGTFDGAGYTVSGLSIDGGTTARYQALFGRIEGATIKNVTVGGTVSAKDAAGIVARMDGGVVSNCVNNVAVTGGAKAGGIVGLYKTGTATVAGNGVIDCSNSGDITDTCSSGTDRIGGIVGIVEASGTPTAAVAIDGQRQQRRPRLRPERHHLLDRRLR